jgi:hypothetical protein
MIYLPYLAKKWKNFRGFHRKPEKGRFYGVPLKLEKDLRAVALFKAV